MAILSGCQEGKSTPRIEEIICPKCGNILEVFIGMGAANAGMVTSDVTCETCGALIPAGAPVSDYEKA